MKKRKLVLALMLALFAGLIFTSCEVEEDEEPAQALTEFIVGGNWVYTELDYSNPTHVGTIIYNANFSDGHYGLSVSDGTAFIEVYGTYTVDDSENILTISNPFYEEGDSDEFNSFVVEWQEGIDEMYWSDTENGSDDVMKWVRNYEE